MILKNKRNIYSTPTSFVRENQLLLENLTTTNQISRLPIPINTHLYTQNERHFCNNT